MNVIRADRRTAIAAIAAALLVLVAGGVEALISIHYNVFPNRGAVIPVVVATAVAVGCTRRAPGAALVLIWLIGAFQIATGTPPLLVQMALAAVVFGTARWGGTATAAAGVVSVPLIGVLTVASDSVGGYGAVLVTALFGICWLAGLALRRFADRAADSLASQRAAEAEAARATRESMQAREIARLREEQAQLARDVHDVVGHSLAVILAQAESARYLADTDTAALHRAMADIANLARSSLRDVRRVLTSTTPSDVGPGELRILVEGVRASGHDITFDEIGTARPLAPERATVAYRVLQEMLTNAMRHGIRTAPITVTVRWADELRIDTANEFIPGQAGETAHSGRGLDGMRRRVESIGGSLDIGRTESTWTVTARVPVRTLVP
ncbi:sensor histidine kinase [Nocardia crassostreae]|uniref:sensor histidine kinase n=1 Tax=Nocardia crassostreae TaxID=53428 RepID=UPI0008346099|nr:histidine kinase [Nocardia crassostreae]